MRKIIIPLAASIVLLCLLLTDTPRVATASNKRVGATDSGGRTKLTRADSLRALEKLSVDLSALITLPSERKAGKVGIDVYSLTREEPVFDLNADAPLTPASTTKIVTAFTAISELGAKHQIRTVIGADARPKDGVIEGNLYIKGFGDPFLTVSDVDALVEKVVASGVKQINGSVIGDGTFFDDVYDRFEYSGDLDEVEPLGPVSALSIERNAFTVIVSSPRTPGGPCNVQTYPRSSGIEIVNSAVSVGAPPRRSKGKSGGKSRKGRKRSYLDPTIPSDPRLLDDENVPRFGDEPLLAYRTQKASQRKPAAKKATTSPTKRGAKSTRTAPKSTKKTAAKTGAKPSTKRSAARSNVAASKSKSAKAPAVSPAKAPTPAAASRGALRVSVSSANGRQVVTVTGGLTANRTVSYRYEMKNPPAVVAGLVYDRLRSNGIRIKGSVTTGAMPQQHHEFAANERPLTQVLHYVMKNSNNYLAEYTFKIIGGAGGGRTETAKRSVEKIQQRMNLCQVPFNRCIINDGSGLSRRNCLSASALTAILTSAYHDRKVFEGLYPLMAIAGVDGTLRGRMKGTPAHQNVHGKTGTLRNVSALAGYVTTRDGELMSFAMLMNGGSIGSYKAVQDKIAVRLASFSYAEALAPQEVVKGTK